MPYSKPENLLIGDIILPGSVDKSRWVQDASDEMDALLGWVYDLPLRKVGEVVDPSPTAENWKTLPLHQQLLLTQINNKLASGRLIMAIAMAGEDQQLHAYGLDLVRQAEAQLMLLANRTIELDAELIVPVDGEDYLSRIPSIKQHDDESLLAGFENTVLRGVPWYTRPGAL